MSGAYRYAVCPPGKMFETRHEAVGFAAVHGRERTYHKLSRIDYGRIPLRIEPFLDRTVDTVIDTDHTSTET